MTYFKGGFRFSTLIFLTLLYVPGLAWAQGLPEGEDRDKVIMACSACHGLDNIFNASNPLSAEDWEFYVYDMIARGAPVRQEDTQDIIDYLVDNFAE